MINPNRIYSNLLEGFQENLSNVSARSHPTKSDKMRKISSILDMKFFPRATFDESFLGRASEAIANTKKQIMMLLNSWENGQFPTTTKNVLEALRELNGDPKIVLECGVLKCYKTILLVHQQDEEIRDNRLFRTLKKVLQQVVRFSIIYNEYQKRDHTVQSQTELDSREESSINQKLIKSIQIQIFKKQFYDLVIQYLNSERIKLKEIKEICRICESKVSVEQMTNHLQHCQKKYYQLQELQLNSTNLLKLKRELKQVESSSGDPSLKSLYTYMSSKIDRTCLNNQNQSSQINSIILEDDSELSLDDDLVMAYKLLIRQRIRIVQTISSINKQSIIQEDSEFLGVNSIIRQSEQEEPRQTSLLKQSNMSEGSDKEEAGSSISIESVKERKLENTSKQQKYRGVKTPDSEQTNIGCRQKKVVKWNIKKALSMNRSFKDFEVLKFLGKGAFGKVYLVRRVLTHDYYAVKCIKMDNKLLEDQKKIQNLKNQHDIFRKISGQFLVKAAFSFSEGSMHMFFLQYMPGGDFGALLDEQVYLQQQTAKFYLAEIVLAIEHLHNLNIIHRDLKPQNLVFDQKGHLKLTDFGLSKQGITKKLLITKEKASSQVKQESQFPEEMLRHRSNTHKRKTLVRRNGKQSSNKSIVGTPDYIAPEVLNGISTDNQSIDWWSFGVIVYEVLIGQKPFGAQTIEKVFTNIRNMQIEWPSISYEEGCITPQAQNLIQSLLNVDFSKRLGAESIDQIKQHPFFEGICWQKLKSMEPPLLVKTGKDYYLHEDVDLREEIEEQMNQICSSLQSKIHLDDYMRIDLLRDKTLNQQQKVVNQIREKKTKISILYKKYVGAAKSMRDVPYN